MRNAICSVLLLLAAACGSSNPSTTDGPGHDGVITGGDGSGSGSSGELTITLTDKPAVLGNVAAPTFAFTTSIPATTECRVDTDAYAACTSPDTVAALADGMHAFDVRATAGSQTAAAPTYSFTVDTVAPAMMITGEPPALSPVATAQFHFTTDDALAPSVMCQLDSQAPAACTSPINYSGLADGSHTFTLTGSDGAGNLATKTYTWTVDTAAPTLTITMEPPDPYSSTSAHFEFTIGTSASVSCQLDSGAATACTSPIDYTGLAQGSHTFTLRGTNQGGMTTTVTYTWTVDTVPPGVTISSEPAPDTNVTSAQFVFTTTGNPTTVTCQLDSGTPAACTSPWTYMSLPDGAHVFTLKATDAAGNSTTKTYNWNVDTDPPVITINSSPSDPSKSASAAFTFTVTGATSTTCKLDSAAATACTTSASYSALGDGNHTFLITATDAAGNVTTKNYMWLVDTIPPALTITSAPPQNWNSPDAQITFTAGADAVTVTCQIDSNTAAACTSPVNYTGLPDGSHTFTVRATDAAGNLASRSSTWTVDTVAPTVAITAHPTSVSNVSSPSFSFSTTGATAGTTCQLDSGAVTACTSPAGYSGVGDGAHTFTVVASDTAGNTATATFSWSIDTTPPVVTIGNKPGANTNQTTASFTFSVSGATSATCQLSPGAPFDCTGLSSYSQTGLGEGTHTFTVTGTDGAGNTATATYTWIVDTTPPTISFTQVPGQKVTSHNVTFAFTFSDGTTQCFFGINPGTPCTSPVSYTLADGNYLFNVQVTDAAGNSALVTYSFTVDTTPPSGTVSYDCTNSSITWHWAVNDTNGINGNCTCTVSGTGGGTSLCASSGMAFYNNVVNTSFSVTCTDTFGNTHTPSASRTMTATQISQCVNM